MKLDVTSLAHTKWECKYHIAFAPKYWRQVIYGKIKQDIGQMLRKLCEYKGVEIIEAEACKDQFQDETGFCRINNPKRCWCRKGVRPRVPCHHISQYLYVYGAVDPASGRSIAAIARASALSAFVFLTLRLFQYMLIHKGFKI